MLGGGAPRVKKSFSWRALAAIACGDCTLCVEFTGERGGETNKSFSGDGGGDRGDSEALFVLGAAFSCISGDVQANLLSFPRGGTDDDFALGGPEGGFDFGRLRVLVVDLFDLLDLALSVLEDLAEVCAFPGLVRLDCELDPRAEPSVAQLRGREWL